MAAAAVIPYIRSSISVKLFPVAWTARPVGARRVLRAAKNANVPVIVLRRRVDHALQSLRKAQRTDRWNLNSWEKMKGGKMEKDEEREIVGKNEMMAFNRSLEWFFNTATTAMREMDVPFDELDYEQIRHQPVILASRNECFIRNCNFAH